MKLRRDRDAAANENSSSMTNMNGGVSGFELYEKQGDTAAAWETMYGGSNTSDKTKAQKYNRLVLDHLHNSNRTALDQGKFLQDLQVFKQNQSFDHLTARKRKRNEFIMIYNQALIHYTQGNFMESAKLCQEHLDFTKKPNPQTWPLEIAKVASRLGLLLLESLLSMRSPQSTTVETTKDFPPLDEIVIWLEKLGLDKQGDAELKFLLSLYKGRVDLASRSADGLHEETRIRSARKELKVAMEVFQHKLRASTDGNSSVSSAQSDDAKDGASTAAASTTTETPAHHQTPQQSMVLQKYNQSALNLKANLEQLKGNVKKSLILCSEAESSSTQETNYYNAIHANNLSLVYQSSQKKHLALHVLSRSLQDNDRSDAENAKLFLSDGTASPIMSVNTVWNAAIIALQAGNFMASYECLTLCLNKECAKFDQGLTWMRLAEACMGLHHQKEQEEPYYHSKAIQVKGEPKALVLQKQAYLKPYAAGDLDDLPALGGEDDLELVMRLPLKRANFAFEKALDHQSSNDEIRQSAKLALAYIALSVEDYTRALGLASAILEETSKDGITSSTAGGSENEGFSIETSSVLRREATARMYAAEAASSLGESLQAMKFLSGAADGEAFDRLASELSGVSAETAKTSLAGKRRLAHAQSAVRSSASAVTATMGNLSTSKQLAMAAQSLEDATSASPTAADQSIARRAHIYCLLRSGDTSAALSLMQAERM